MRNIVKIMSFNTFIPFVYPALMFPIKHWRKKAINMLNLRPGDRILVPGAGSGHDLTLLPRDVDVVGVDLSDVMLGIGKVKVKAFGLDKNVTLMKMDAEQLAFDDNSFDKAILSLFLTVVFDPRKAFAEVVRVVKPGGRILIYDHLFRKGELPKVIAKPVDTVLSYGFASVTRVLDEIIEGMPVTIEQVQSGDPVGFVKGYLLKKAG